MRQTHNYCMRIVEAIIVARKLPRSNFSFQMTQMSLKH